MLRTASHFFTPQRQGIAPIAAMNCNAVQFQRSRLKIVCSLPPISLFSRPYAFRIFHVVDVRGAELVTRMS
jgi:hypothetical protein